MTTLQPHPQADKVSEWDNKSAERLLKQRPAYSLEAAITWFNGKAGECKGGFFDDVLYTKIVRAKAEKYGK